MIAKHFGEYMCEVNGCVEPIGSLPDPRGDSIMYASVQIL